MKMLIAVEGLENFLIDHPDVPIEVGAFVGKLIRDRARRPEPRVLVLPVGENNVMVDVDQLFGLQQRAAEKHLQRSHAEQLLREIVMGDPASVEDDKKMMRAIATAKEHFQ